ncbi:hypothetical protein BOX15_Mlig023832g2 [Macrostomum lignano]|uniref:Uncharacterized protein n=1 Tax=Macrostomum lignano TaxID=282301 RepID=A0A267GY61_9PLAT|nr:hypothetical protein BOX15_Mlig023832g1 [Macrostomum lignano]PAA90960.1 hypothetical protein BOX15_Mlig023832g2 [Macrostomum lignano]
MMIMNSFVNDVFERVAGEASRLAITTASAAPSAAARSRLLSACCCLASWPSTPSARAPRPSPSTPAPSKTMTSLSYM